MKRGVSFTEWRRLCRIPVRLFGMCDTRGFARHTTLTVTGKCRSSFSANVQRAPTRYYTDGGSLLFYSRRRPTFPHSCPCSIIGPEGLNFRVRDGNGCDPLGIATEKSLVVTLDASLRIVIQLHCGFEFRFCVCVVGLYRPGEGCPSPGRISFLWSSLTAD